MLYQFDMYSIGIFGGGTVIGALEFSLDELLNWCRDEDETAFVIQKLHNFTDNGILSFDYTCGDTRKWHELSVA